MGKHRKVIKSQSYTKTTYDRPPPQQSSISKDVAQKKMWLIIQKVTSANKDLTKSIKDMIATADLSDYDAEILLMSISSEYAHKMDPSEKNMEFTDVFFSIVSRWTYDRIETEFLHTMRSVITKEKIKEFMIVVETRDPQQLQAFFQSNKEISEKLMDMMIDPRLLHLMVSRIPTN